MLANLRARINGSANAGIVAAALLGASLVLIALSLAVTLPLSGPMNRPLEVYKVGCVAGAFALLWILWALFGRDKAIGRFRIATWLLLSATIFMIGSIAGMLAMGYGKTTPLIDSLVQTSGILTYVSTALALFTLPADKMVGPRKLPWIFDTALIVTAISGAGWYFIIAPQVQFTGGNRFSLWLTLVYPLANLISIAAVVAAASLGGPFKSARGLLIVGIVLNVAGDVVQAIYMQKQMVPPAGLIFTVWIASTLLVGLAALQARRDTQPVGSDRQLSRNGVTRAVLPILFLSGLVILTLWGNADRAGRVDAVGLNIACVVALICCLGRMLCLLQDNSELAASLEEANESLDLQVQERTQQLSHALEELDGQRRFLRSVIDALPSFVVSQKPNGEVVLANNAAMRAFGQELALYPKGSSPSNLIVSGLTMTDEQVLDCADGQAKTFEVVRTPVGDSSDQLLVVGNDVTVRKEAERTLIEARNAAEEANRVKSEFLAKMSHELRTPLHGIIGLSELMLAESMSRPQRELAANIRSSAENLQGLLIDVLDLAHPQPDGEIREVSLCDLCSEIVEPFRARAADRGIRLRADIHLDPEERFAIDLHRVRQILSHLLSNAVKFTEKGEVRFIVDVLRRAQATCHVRFTVSDSGIGMDADDLARAFRPFEQLDNSMHRRFGGAGLGLSICKAFADQLNGSIHARSEPAVGSTFVVELPLQTVKSEAGASLTGTLPHMKILVAEDNAVNQMILKRQLERLGCDVQLANDGCEAVELVQANTYDAILMDCQMPVLDGIEASRRIRSLGYRLPIIAVTANAMPGDRERCISAGMDDYLAKPIRVDALVDVLTRTSALRRAA